MKASVRASLTSTVPVLLLQYPPQNRNNILSKISEKFPNFKTKFQQKSFHGSETLVEINEVTLVLKNENIALDLTKRISLRSVDMKKCQHAQPDFPYTHRK